MTDQLTDLFGPAGYILGVMLLAGAWLFKEERKDRKEAEARERDALTKVADNAAQASAELHASIQTVREALGRLGVKI